MSRSHPYDLLGYLLGALEPEEAADVERAVRNSPSLQQALDALRETLGHLPPCEPGAADAANAMAPPPGLVDRTLALVEELSREYPLASQAAASQTTPLSIAAHPRESAAAATPRSVLELDEAPGRGWALVDVGVLLTMGLAAAFIFLPALAESRFDARVVFCQNNLRQVGLALAAYSDGNHGLFPHVAAEGKLAAAGIYAPTMVQADLVPAGVFVCPDSQLAANRQPWHIPTLDEIAAADDGTLRWLHQIMGGSYGYNLGVQEAGRYVTPRHSSRAYFAVASDAPSLHLPQRRTVNHRSRGQNVLYEDCHVGWIIGTAGISGDDVFHSFRGFVEPGISPDDSVIGRSETSPALALQSP